MTYKQCIAACTMFMFSLSASSVFAATEPKRASKVLLEIENSWKLPSKPLDIVYSLDGRKVFILTDQNQVLVYAVAGDLLGKINVEKGVSAIDIAPRGEKLYLVNEKDNSFTDLSVDFIIDIDITGSPYLGKENAPVTIAIFTDFECPYCGQVAPLLEQVLEHNPDTVKIVLKNMPLRMHKFAKPAAYAALAAGEQGKFWEFHDELFDNAPKLDQTTILKIADKLELDIAKFKKDMASPATEQKVNKDLADAQELGVTGTPTIFVNGVKFKRKEEPAAIQQLQKLIDEELAQKAD